MSSFLQQYQRQPKLFIDLPSKGKYYNSTIIEDEQYVQVPVFGMNAMDEIMFKTPDALFTGESTAQVIKSCIPSILDPWNLVGFDIDYVLIAIRIATYGDEMPITTKCSKCDTETQSSLSLTRMIQKYETFETAHSFEVNDLKFNLKPLTYRQMTNFSIENYSFERQLIEIGRNNDMTDEEKNKNSKNSYSQINNLNLRVAISYIESVKNEISEETNIDEISNFVAQNDSVFYNKLKDNIYELSNRWRTPTIDVSCSDEECNHDYRSNVELDYSNFFGLRFLHSRNLIY
mgnify:CR=1 FL=1|jgi:hypothetical protein